MHVDSAILSFLYRNPLYWVEVSYSQQYSSISSKFFLYCDIVIAYGGQSAFSLSICGRKLNMYEKVFCFMHFCTPHTHVHRTGKRVYIDTKFYTLHITKQINSYEASSDAKNYNDFPPKCRILYPRSTFAKLQ